jgi:hypothetical protein
VIFIGFFEFHLTNQQQGVVFLENLIVQLGQSFRGGARTSMHNNSNETTMMIKQQQTTRINN